MPTATIPEVKVPWDRELLKGRECANCACYFEATHAEHPDQYQGFCRRHPGQLTQSRVQVPRLDKENKPVMKNGLPVMNNEVAIGFLYAVTQRQGTCFEGYRPIGTLPGERPMPEVAKELVRAILRLKAIPSDVRDDLAELLGRY